MNELQLTGEQRAAALDFGGELCVSAAAGSGKTTVLIERYLAAVHEQKCSPQELLAVTFTEKAAGEMKKRLLDACEKRGWDSLRLELENSWIGTIHGFCARILRENPLECAIDPEFSVMGEGESELLMSRILDDLFEKEAENAAWLEVLKDFGETKVRTDLGALYALLKAHGTEEPGAAFLAMPSEEARQDFIGFLKRETAVQAGDAPEIRYQTAVRALSATIPEKKGWPRIQAIALTLETLDARSPKTRESVKDLRKRLERWTQAEISLLGMPAKKEFLRVFSLFKNAYNAEKQRLARYDFEDLLFFMHRALSSEKAAQMALRRRLRERFRQIFVDEYQDTSPLQAAILDKIKSGGNLFMVGDLRQSIYGFRHADPEVFHRALRSSEKRSLCDNYRSRPEIIRFVNAVFGRLFSGEFEALKPARAYPAKMEPSIEWNVVPAKKGRSLDAARVLEARSLAARIRQMVDAGRRYRDFALLFRTAGSGRLFEKELEDFGIPYFTVKGQGFYEKAEVVDLVHFLRLLDDPAEDIALAAVLRSPLVQLSDDALFWIGRSRAMNEPFFEALKRHAAIAEISGDDRTKITAFLERLERFRNVKDRLQISEILERLLAETAYRAKCLARPGGRQAEANALKLVDLARSSEEAGIAGIGDFVSFVRNLAEREKTEPEARIIGEDEDVVRLLTVHAAKGLEFPCVVIADMGSEKRPLGQNAFLADVALGLGAKIKNPLDGESYADESFARIQEKQKTKDAGESDRLLYVAATRAKEHLILSGAAPAAGEANADGTWMKRILAAVQTDFEKEIWEWEGVSMRRLPLVEKKAALSRAGKAPFSADSLQKAEIDPKAIKEMEQRLLPVEKPYEALEDLSVTQLAAASSGAGVRGFWAAADDEESAPRNEFGTVFHRLMEWAVKTGKPAISEESFKRWTVFLSESEKTELRAGFELFWKGPYGAEIRSAKRRHAELPFIYKTRHGILKGQIDLAYENAAGEWVILDYKTNRIARETMKSAASEYAWQIGLYSLVFRELFGAQPKKGVLYFSVLHEAFESYYTKQDLDRFAARLDSLYREAVSLV